MKVKQVATGNFKSGQAELYDVSGSFMASSKGSQAWFYVFDKDGTYQQIATVSDSAAGPVRHLAVGDLLNNGKPVTVVVNDNLLYILRSDGTSSKLDLMTTKILIGDFTGDGKREGLFVTPASDGTQVLQLISFGTETKELAKVTGVKLPNELVRAHAHSDGIELPTSYRRDDKNNLVFVLYKFDATKGLVPVVEYPVADPADRPATWYGTGTIYDGGAGMAITRQGPKPSVDLFALNVDGADLLGSFNLPGGQDHAVLLGTSQGDEPRVMSIDEQGRFFIYQVSE